jgi:peroxiredoxin
MLPKKLKNSHILNIFLTVSFLFNVHCYAAENSNSENSNNGLSVGETIPNPAFFPLTKYEPDQMPKAVKLQDYKEGKNLLIAFMPAITDKNIYANVMTSAFDTYFAKGLSFGVSYNYYYPNPDLKILIVTRDNEQAVQEYMKKTDADFDMASDKNMDIANFFGIKEWNSDNSGSHVYLVNKDNKIVYANYDYKGEGEKLKAVQSQLYSLLNIKDDMSSFKEYNPLMAGDNARDFNFKYVNPADKNSQGASMKEGKLSDYTGKKNVLIAFYPAAFSYSCSAEVVTFDLYAEQQKMIQRVQNSEVNNDGSLEILMVSVSNSGILSKWKNAMNLQNLKLVSDDNGEISMMYNSYNQLGYNKRTIFLVDKEGKLSYIDWDYKVDDTGFAKLKEQLMALK